MAVETHPQIDFRAYAEMYPQSDVLSVLAATDEQDEAREDWWSNAVDEYHAAILPIDGIVAAYYGVMHPVSLEIGPEERGPANARRLVAGEKFALHWPNTHRGGIRSNYSGILAEDAVALLGHPSGNSEEKYFAHVDFGIRLVNRKDTLRVYPDSTYLIGDNEIATYYRDLVVNSEELVINNPLRYGKRVIETAGVVTRLGIEIDDNKVHDFEAQILRSLREVVKPDRFDYDAHARELTNPENVIKMLRYFHAMDANGANKRIDDFARDPFYMESDILSGCLAETVAQIRSAYALDSLPTALKQLYLAQAGNELYEIWQNTDLSSDPAARITDPYK